MNPKVRWARLEIERAKDAILALADVMCTVDNPAVRIVRLSLEENLYWARRRLADLVSAL
jgi:hypothetical protein